MDISVPGASLRDNDPSRKGPTQSAGRSGLPDDPSLQTTFSTSDGITPAQGDNVQKMELAQQWFQEICKSSSAPVQVMHHGLEVAAILKKASYKPSIVVAGLFHDLLEGKITQDVQQLSALIGKIEAAFGEETVKLIEAVTEPRFPMSGVSEDISWYARKWTALKRLTQAGADAAALSCAAKISTLRAGLNYYERNGKLAGWSKGSIEDNAVFFESLRREYVKKNISADLLILFDKELLKFAQIAAGKERPL